MRAPEQTPAHALLIVGTCVTILVQSSSVFTSATAAVRNGPRGDEFMKYPPVLSCSTVSSTPFLGRRKKAAERNVLNFSTVRSSIRVRAYYTFVKHAPTWGRTVLKFSTVRSFEHARCRGGERTVLQFSTVRSRVRNPVRTRELPY